MSTEHRLFEVFGVELEYMLVSKENLNVLSKVDEVLKAAAGTYTTDYVDNNTGWANELASHVMEVRCDDPVANLRDLRAPFKDAVDKINRIAESLNARLMPTAMHPWMNPAAEGKLWPHEYREVYEKFDRIFNCKRHGWMNLQSCQLNLPFNGDKEFAALHAAIRLLLPIMPGIASSSPIAEGRKADYLNYRLQVYKDNAAITPLVAGQCIPEPVYTRKAYEEELLPSIYEQIKPHDTEGTLQHEWLNARGAIARFDRSAIEIRILDIQENPQVDLAICEAVTAVLKALIAGRFTPLEEVMTYPIAPLKKILDEHNRSAGQTLITDTDYLKLWGIKENKITSQELWRYLLQDKVSDLLDADTQTRDILNTLLTEGTLSERIVASVNGDFLKSKLVHIYGELCDCLARQQVFHA